ncbi:MAG: hypothetical protein HY216_13415 [Candidatus Rokubacteria bacterium]|nr:hypothetical protein [Candidatus Rokubacteria bacterium]
MSRSLWRVGVTLGLLALVPAVPRLADAGTSDRIGATFSLMAEEFIKAAQPLEALVIGMEGTAIFLDAGQQAGVQPGQEFTVFRKGEAFLHPVTGKPMGRYEQVLGHAQVRRVQPQFSEAVFIPITDRPQPRPEDGARITRGRIKLAVTPVLDLTEQKNDVRRVPYLLASLLERSKRFQIIDPLTVADTFASGGAKVEEVLGRPEQAVRVAKNLEVAGWLVPMLIERRGVLYLDITWISAVTGTPLFSRRQPLVSASSGEEQRFPWEPRPED